MDEDRILDKLEVLEAKIDALTARVASMNGTQQAHTAWIAARTEMCLAHRTRTDALSVESGAQHDYLQTQRGQIAGAKYLLWLAWAAFGAMAVAVGAWLDRLVHR